MGHAFSANALLRDLAAAREDTLWSAMRAITVEADLARRLAEGSLAMTGKRLIFSKQVPTVPGFRPTKFAPSSFQRPI
jgi:hypothetical protein